MKCELCGCEDFEYKTIEKDTYIGTYNIKVPKNFLRGEEFSLGTDYFAKEDFLKLTCKRCKKIYYKGKENV